MQREQVNGNVGGKTQKVPPSQLGPDGESNYMIPWVPQGLGKKTEPPWSSQASQKLAEEGERRPHYP
jgi:hypothetical protein